MPWVLLVFIGLWAAMVMQGRQFYVDGVHGCLDCEIAALLIAFITWPTFGIVLLVKGGLWLDRLLESREAERNRTENA